MAGSFIDNNYDNIVAVLLLIAPQFATTDTATIQGFYKYCLTQVSPEAFGTNYNDAMANLMAHYMTLALNPLYADAGVFSEKTLGEARVRYNNATTMGGVAGGASMQDYQRTQYGITYNSLIEKSIFPAVTSNASQYMGGAPIPLPPIPYYTLYGY